MAQGERTRFLMHWTGKPRSPATQEREHLASPEAYVNLLESILSGGLRLMPCSEFGKFEFNTSDGLATGGSGRMPRMACFTEVRLSHSRRHADQYGRMGLGFSREFVLDYLGGPVFYTRGRGTDTHTESIAGLLDFINKLAKSETVDAEIRQSASEHFQRAYTLLAFMKSMTDVADATETFERLHEHEWRIVDTRRLRSTRALKEFEADRFAVPLQPGDVRLLVMPDAPTRDLALAHEVVRHFIDGVKIPPLVVTLDEAEQL